MNFILYIFFPFFAFLRSLKNFLTTQSAVVFVLFYILFGYCFTFELTTADSFRAAYYFYVGEHNMLQDIIDSYRDGGVTDIFRPVTYSITSLFTHNPKILFAIYGFLFGVISYLSIRILVKERVGKNDFYTAILLIIFFLFNSILNMNGMRFWFATWVFFYFTAQHFIYNKQKAIIGIILSPLIHFAYIIVVGYILLLKLYLIFFRRNSLKILFVGFILSFFASFTLPETTIQDTIGEGATEMRALNYKYNIYTNMAEDRTRKGDSLYVQANNTFTTYSRHAAKVMAFVLCIIIYRRFSKLKKTQNTNILFALVLALFIMSFLSFSLMSISGARYLMMSWLFLVYLLFRIYNENREKIWQRCIISIIPTVALYYIISLIFNGYRLVTPMLWFMNLPYLIYDGIGFGHEIMSY